MRVRVLYFGIVRERLGLREETLELPAASSVGDLMRTLAGRHAAVTGGRLIAMKGVHPFEEIAQLPKGWRVLQVIALKIPGVEAQRHLVALGAKTQD